MGDLDPAEGRQLYGQDPETYDRGRPDYPDLVYERLRDRCGLGAGTTVLEIGPGTGLVTRHLLRVGAAVTAVEPSAAMAEHLGRTLADPRLDVVDDAFETAVLPDAGFDLAVAATSFHWVARPAGVRRLRRVLRSGGCAAIWWMLFDDWRSPDELSRLVEELAGEPPSAGGGEGGRPFQLDAEARRRELSDEGFLDVCSEVLPSTVELTPATARDLYGSLAVVLRRPPPDRVRILDAVEACVRDRSGGLVRREAVTALYTARNP